MEQIDKKIVVIVKSGKLIVHSQNSHTIAEASSVCFLEPGNYCIERIPDQQLGYESMLFLFDEDELEDDVKDLYGEICFDSVTKEEISSCISEPLTHDLHLLTNYLEAKIANGGKRAFEQSFDRIHKRELIALLLFKTSEKMHQKLLSSARTGTKSFRRKVQEYAFVEMPMGRIAAQFGMSTFQFKERFRKEFDTTPLKWFITQRIEKAAVLLRATDIPVCEISTTCMFRNVSHFIKVFKKTHTDTPMDYRNNWKEQRK